MVEWFMSVIEDLLIVSSRPTIGQGLSNFSSLERGTSARCKFITHSVVKL